MQDINLEVKSISINDEYSQVLYTIKKEVGDKTELMELDKNLLEELKWQIDAVLGE